MKMNSVWNIKKIVRLCLLIIGTACTSCIQKHEVMLEGIYQPT